MKKFTGKNGKLLSIMVAGENWKKDLNFITNDEDFLQVGTWWYNKGRVLDRHHHNILPRNTNITQECVVVMAGAMRVRLYDLDQSFVDEYDLVSGDFAVFFYGGHEYEILIDDTKIIETKNGPFLGVDADKTRF